MHDFLHVPSLQLTSNYERYAHDAISVLGAVISNSVTEENTSFIDHVNNISFNGASVSLHVVHIYYTASTYSTNYVPYLTCHLDTVNYNSESALLHLQEITQ